MFLFNLCHAWYKSYPVAFYQYDIANCSLFIREANINVSDYHFLNLVSITRYACVNFCSLANLALTNSIPKIHDNALDKENNLH